MSTLAEDIEKLAQDESVMWAVRVLTDKGINGVLYDKLIAMTTPKIGYTIHQDDGTGVCTTCGTGWPN